jgi:addiction module HigA family antidote
MAKKQFPPIHPGEILRDEFIERTDLSQHRLAKDIGVPPRRVNEIVLGKRGITADTALRLARFFGTTEQVWMKLQTRFDLEMARDKLGSRLKSEVRILRTET